jgi:hypothetical protein
MEVHSENYKGFRVAVYQMGDRYACAIFTGAFGYHIVAHFAEGAGFPVSRLFNSIEDAVAHAKNQIDAEKLRP